ncbi:UNVERIFIED_CONTAM: hypothetical protein K2H54_056984 [Gekko kuhli]
MVWTSIGENGNGAIYGPIPIVAEASAMASMPTSAGVEAEEVSLGAKHLEDVPTSDADLGRGGGIDVEVSDVDKRLCWMGI